MSRSAANWDFVYNNYTDEGLSQLIDVFSKKSFFKKCEGYYEVGESGTPHIQGYFSYYKKTTIKCILTESGINDGILKDKISIRPVRNLNAVINYVRKDGNIWWKSENEISDADYYFGIVGRCNNVHKNLYDEFNIYCDLIKIYRKNNVDFDKKLFGLLYDDKFDEIKACGICSNLLCEDWELL